MELIGKATIHPVIFYSGKISGYITWIISFLTLCGIELVDKKTCWFNNYIAAFLLLAGLVFMVISLVNLGKSTRLGIPTNETALKTNGLYSISRNPMYVGFNLITIASMLYALHGLVLVLGIYSIVVYHLIIKGEEDFMIKRFGNDYRIYQSKVRRYI
jgi:protein-S-isoprenylcysteine O-methyltransferase Ste14